MAGIAFGLIMMMQKNNSESSLNKQISTLKSQVTQLQNQVEAVPETVDVDTTEYVYVGEWGIKIKTTAQNYSFGGDTLNFAFENGSSASITRILTASIQCNETEGECVQYDFEVGDYSYLVSVNGDVPVAVNAELADDANYSLIYELAPPVPTSLSPLTLHPMKKF